MQILNVPHSILILSSAKLLQYWSQSGRTHLLEMLLKDGVQYFAVVCSVNIVNVVYLNSKVVYGGVSFDGGAFVSLIADCVRTTLGPRLRAVSLTFSRIAVPRLRPPELCHGPGRHKHDGLQTDHCKCLIRSSAASNARG